MSRIALSDSGDWKLQFPDDQDIRGFRALDKDGTPVGVVDTMIVNTDEERVDAVLLEDGTEYPARDLSIGDGVVYLTAVDAGAVDAGAVDASADVDGEVRVYGDNGRVLRSEPIGGDYDAHADAFRTHHGSAYGTGTYEDYEPAYRYGFESAHEDEYRNAAFVDDEDRLKATYGSRHADRDYDADRAAIRYGYTRAQHTTR